jgi:hypothetical protein
MTLMSWMTVGLRSMRLGHAIAVELEGAFRLAAGKHLEGLFVVEGILSISIFALDLLDALDGVGDDGEVPDTEEVELEEAGFLDGVHVVLGDDLVLALGIVLERGVVGHSGGRDDHAGGMHEMWRALPSIFLAISIMRLVSASSLYNFFKSGFSFMRARWS